MKRIRIGTRESELAVWQATQVEKLLSTQGFYTELVFIKSEGDIDLKTPLYEMGVQGVFTKSLDAALLNNKIDIAVHSMKDVPTQLARGIVQAAVLKRGSYKDLLVYNGQWATVESILNSGPDMTSASFTIATSSIRRKAQWLHRYPGHAIEVLRGNVNTRLRKLKESNWNGAVFAAAGLERIGLRPQNSIELDWMLPAPAQGAIMVVCRKTDDLCIEACNRFNDTDTALCTRIERDFLRTLLGGCSTPISALAEIKDAVVFFKGNILSLDGKEKVSIDLSYPVNQCGEDTGTKAAKELLNKGADKIVKNISDAG